MVKKTIRLPEKEFFTLEEIAERWDCGCGLVSHYLSEGWLRLALDTKHFNVFMDMLDLEDILKLARDAKVGWPDVLLHPMAELSCQSLPRFLYIKHNDDREFYQVEDFSGRKFSLVYRDSPRKEGHDTYYLNYITLDECVPPVITREEVDRFEKTLEVQDAENPKPTLPSYTTPYLQVMYEAVTEFFEPRRTVDAKREEVEAWISTRLQAAGTEGSKRIASAMFTIIKPSDHNPRKRRV